MILYFADRKFNILGMASTGQLPEALLFYEDLETQEIEKGTTVLTGYLSIENNLAEINKVAKIGNYILIEDEFGNAKFYTIIRKEKNRKNQEVFIYSEDAGLDLLNEVVDEWPAPTKAQPISYYIQKAIYDSGFEIGINEVTMLSKVLTWDSDTTATKRLLAIAKEFDNAELSFSFDVKGMKVTKKYVNIHKKRGNNKSVQLNLNRDIENIVTEESIEQLATSFRVKGGKPKGAEQLLTLEGYTYDDGRFYTEGIYLHDRKALSIWSRYLSESGDNFGPLVVNYSNDTLSQAELCQQAVTELKKRAEVEVNYTVDISVLPEDVKIGDTIFVIDDEDALYLEARILKLERSRSKGTAVATLGEYLITDSGVNSRLQDLADKIAAVKDGNPGDTFYPWIRYADDANGSGFSPSPSGKKYFAQLNVKNQPVPSDNPTDYQGKWIKFVGADGTAGIQGQKGEDGKPTYTWIRYADTVAGTGISVDAIGKKYIGFAYNKMTSTPSTIATDYVWSAMYDEAKLSELADTIAGVPRVFMQANTPTNVRNGDQWWVMSNNQVTGYKVHGGGKWNDQTIQQSLLNIVKLNAVEITGSTMTGTTINGSTFINTFKDIYSNGALLSGTTAIAEGKYRTEGTTNTNQSFVTEITPLGLMGTIYTDNKKSEILNSYSLSSSGLTFYDKSYGSGGLSAQYLTNYPWWWIGLSAGYSWPSTAKNEYRPKAKLVFIGSNPFLQFFGIVTRSTAGGGGGGWNAFGTLDLAGMKAKQFMTADANGTVSVGNGDGATLGLQTSGTLVMRTPGNWTEMRIGGLMPLT